MKTYNHKQEFKTSEIRNYQKSNASVNVSFDSLEEAKAHVENELKAHPRSKKVELTIKSENTTYTFCKYTKTWN